MQTVDGERIRLRALPALLFGRPTEPEREPLRPRAQENPPARCGAPAPSAQPPATEPAVFVLGGYWEHSTYSPRVRLAHLWARLSCQTCKSDPMIHVGLLFRAPGRLGLAGKYGLPEGAAADGDFVFDVLMDRPPQFRAVGEPPWDTTHRLCRVGPLRVPLGPPGSGQRLGACETAREVARACGLLLERRLWGWEYDFMALAQGACNSSALCGMALLPCAAPLLGLGRREAVARRGTCVGMILYVLACAAARARGELGALEPLNWDSGDLWRALRVPRERGCLPWILPRSRRLGAVEGYTLVHVLHAAGWVPAAGPGGVEECP